MAEDQRPSSSGSLNPQAPSFTMPAARDESPTSSQPLSNGTSATPSDRPAQGTVRSTTAEDVAEAGAGANLTPAQLKKQKQAEKAARRAEKVAQKGADAQAPSAPEPQAQLQTPASTKAPRRPSVGGKKDSAGQSHHKRTGSTQVKQLPIRPQGQVQPVPAAPTGEDKKVAMFSHLRSKEERPSIASAGREIHPAVLSLGLQLRDYVICGANARCVAMLLVFKKVIQSYITPPGVALSRHLTTHLSHQISYINHARPLGVSQGNAIRWLKKLISALDPDLEENEAKKFLVQSVDQFVREKVTLADEVIAREAGQRVDDGDVVVTFGKSSVVEKTLISAHKGGKRFSVIVVDSRPMFEGKNLARTLIREGIETRYTLLSGLGDVIADATKCIFGAAAMLGNGRLSARAGTAMTAMMVKECTRSKAPVIVLCESVKFTGKSALDSFMMNELGEADALVEYQHVENVTTKVVPPSTTAGKKGKQEDTPEVPKRGLDGWRDQKGLFLLSLMYDVTPADYLDVVVSELGSLPPSAVSEVNRLHGGEE
jgi:translation initiation factor eIF-2B subunit delta